MFKGDTSNNMKLVHWPLMGWLLHLVQRSLSRPLLAVPNVTAHPSTVSLPITVLLYNGPLLCSFNMPVKGLNMLHCGPIFVVHSHFTPIRTLPHIFSLPSLPSPSHATPPSPFSKKVNKKHSYRRQNALSSIKTHERNTINLWTTYFVEEGTNLNQIGKNLTRGQRHATVVHSVETKKHNIFIFCRAMLASSGP